jgi:hypothetical protein
MVLAKNIHSCKNETAGQVPTQYCGCTVPPIAKWVAAIVWINCICFCIVLNIFLSIVEYLVPGFFTFLEEMGRIRRIVWFS